MASYKKVNKSLLAAQMVIFTISKDNICYGQECFVQTDTCSRVYLSVSRTLDGNGDHGDQQCSNDTHERYPVIVSIKIITNRDATYKRMPTTKPCAESVAVHI